MRKIIYLFSIIAVLLMAGSLYAGGMRFELDAEATYNNTEVDTIYELDHPVGMYFSSELGPVIGKYNRLNLYPFVGFTLFQEYNIAKYDPVLWNSEIGVAMLYKSFRMDIKTNAYGTTTFGLHFDFSGYNSK